MRKSRKKLKGLERLGLKKKLGTLLIILICSSCGSLPRKPSIDLCVHNEPSGDVFCVNNQTSQDTTIRIEDTDRYIMMSPEHWGLTLRYIRILEQRLRGSNSKNSTFVADEVQKIITTGESLLY